MPQSFGSSTKLYTKIDEVPVLIEIPGQGDPEKIIRVTLNNGIGPNWTIYELDMQTEEVKIKGPMVEKNYQSYDKEDVYYGVLNAISELAKQAFKQVGIEYNVETKELSIDEALLLEKSGLGSGYDIEVENLMDRIVVKVRKGEYEVASVYDLTTNMASIQDDVGWAENLIWNVADGEPLVSEDTAAAAVTRMSIADEIRKSGKKILGFVNGVIVTTNAADMAWKQFLFNVKKKPMERPVDPDITDIVWMNRDIKSVMVKGTAGSGVRPKIYVTRNGNTYEDGDANSLVESWERLVFLGEGENKINAIVRTPDGREVESGDATVYVGTQEVEPDLILVSPRDRQVFYDKDMNKNYLINVLNIQFKGRITPGFGIKCNEVPVEINLDGTFDFNNLEIEMYEGDNIIDIAASGGFFLITLKKVLIGAYKFTNHNKDKGYIIRRGDFLFSDKRNAEFLGIKFPFELLPLDPDHVGIYIGNKEVLDAFDPVLRKTDLSSIDPVHNFYYQNLYYVTQTPKLIDEEIRVKVATQTSTTEGMDYDQPIFSAGSILGHYDEGKNGYYCSELAYSMWKNNKADFGVRLEDLMYPFRGIKMFGNSILPAYFCEKTMEVREVNK